MTRFFVFIISLFSVITYSQEQLSSIPFRTSKIVLDGEINEAIWKELPEITNFHNLAPTDAGLAKNQTSVKLFHNGSKLFVRAIYNDSTSKVQVSSLKRDVSIALSDAFIMVFDTQNQQQSGYLFAANAYGTQVDALVEKKNQGYGLNFSWSTIWEVKTSQQGNQKIYEIAIPLKSLNYNKNNNTFGIQMYVRDIKNNSWTIMTDLPRNYPTFDLRFTKPFIIEKFPNKAASRFAVTPSVTFNYQKDIENNIDNTDFTPSLDVQYNVTSSLKLDVTVNPDFSQIDVDQQVTNLSRFSVFFPERRNFFLENADLFSNLGINGITPFYSRKIGANRDIKFGVKFSGNVSPKTRVGVLNVQTDREGVEASQNYGALVVEQQLSKNFTTTGFLINRQETDGVDFVSDYNRVTGVNLNYKSNNNKWIGLANYGKSFNNGVSGKDNFYNLGVWFNKRGFSWNAAIKNIQKNYITDVGFAPRLYNYDAINDEVVREGYKQISGGVQYVKFYDKSKNINRIRYLNYDNQTYFDENGMLNQSSHFLNSAIFFKDLSALYYGFNYDVIDLKYGFDPLRNGNALVPKMYRFGILKLGYNSANNQKLRYRINVQKGNYYNGDRFAGGLYLNYQLLPFANLEASYDVNSIDLNELGKETFHLTKFTGEVFFNTRLNWTTYVQYNTQRENFNINTRLQWEYKPLSYVYLVVSDNFNKRIHRKNWGVAFKMNYRFDF